MTTGRPTATIRATDDADHSIEMQGAIAFEMSLEGGGTRKTLHVDGILSHEAMRFLFGETEGFTSTTACKGTHPTVDLAIVVDDVIVIRADDASLRQTCPIALDIWGPIHTIDVEWFSFLFAEVESTNTEPA